jgi:hypothetical protein
VRRLQFSLRVLLVAILVVAAFFGGMAMQRGFDEPKKGGPGSRVVPRIPIETITLRDGSHWLRIEDDATTLELPDPAMWAKLTAARKQQRAKRAEIEAILDDMEAKADR